MGQRGPGYERGAHDVGLEGFAPPCGVGVRQGDDRDETGAVDNVVEAAQLLHSFVDDLLAQHRVGDVAVQADGAMLTLGSGTAEVIVLTTMRLPRWGRMTSRAWR